jgi:hypothetical protein
VVTLSTRRPLISYYGELAYRVTNVGKKDMLTFDAIRQVNSAAMGVRHDLDPPEGEQAVVIVLVPVVVTDAELFECRLDSSAQVDLKPVDRGLLLSRLRPERLQSVWIVNERAVANFAAQARTTAESMRLDL